MHVLGISSSLGTYSSFSQCSLIPRTLFFFYVAAEDKNRAWYTLSVHVLKIPRFQDISL